MTRIAVAGGTGTVGRHVVQAVRAAGREPVVLARSTGPGPRGTQTFDAWLVRARDVRAGPRR